MTTKDKKFRVMKNIAVKIDSTESITKIQNYFFEKNRRLYQRYCRLIGQRPIATRCEYPHHFSIIHPLNTFNADWDGVLPTNYLEPFTYRCSFPAILSPMENIGCQDPVTGIMKDKYNWVVKTRRMIHGLSTSQIHKEFQLLNDKVANCPKHLLSVAAELENDPDPYFNSYYNWYYAGNGNMQVIYLNGKDYILHSGLNKLYFSEFSLEDMKINYDHVFSYDCGEGSLILETVISPEYIIALRLKTRVIILKMIIKHSSIEIEKLREIETSTAYTGIGFDPHNHSILYVTTLDNKLSIINIDIMKARSVKLPDTDSLENNWSTVNGFDRNMYGHINSKSIQIYDKRANNIIYTVKDHVDLTDYDCNIFSVVKKCEGIPFLYVGTSHHMFLMDFRYTQNHEPKMVQRWTHGMKSPPTYLSLCKFEVVKDLVCISSQWYEDTVIVPNESDTFARGVQTSHMAMPFKPPTVHEAMISARKKQLCVDIQNPIETRLFTSITGNAVVEKDEKYHVLSQTSLGDIFCHTLYPQHISVPQDHGLEKLHDWNKAKKETERIYEVSNIIDISNLWKNLKKAPDDCKFGCEPLMKIKQQYSLEEIMEAYEKDEIDSGLLDVWLGEEKDATALNPGSLTIDLHYSDSE